MIQAIVNLLLAGCFMLFLGACFGFGAFHAWFTLKEKKGL